MTPITIDVIYFTLQALWAFSSPRGSTLVPAAFPAEIQFFKSRAKRNEWAHPYSSLDRVAGA